MKKFIWIFCSLILTVAVSAQSSSCIAFHTSAFDVTQSLCSATGRNQACYGNNTVSLTSFADTYNIEFDSPGDIADVDKIRSLSLSSLNRNSDEWGIALLRLLANLNPEQPENLTLILFGDVEVETATDELEVYPVLTNVASNMRQYPNTNAFVTASIPQNTEVNVVGRLADSSWLQVHYPEDNRSGWISAQLLSYDSVDEIPIVEATQPYFGPMQAFYYRGTGSGDSLDCSTVPSNGLMIQTPEGVGRVTVWVNEVTFDFLANTASTAMIYPPDDSVLAVDMLEGTAAITTNQGGYVAVAGTSVTIETSNDNNSTPRVNPPEPIAEPIDNSLASSLLPRDVDETLPADVVTLAQVNNLTPIQYSEVIEYGYVVTANEPTVQTSGTASNNSNETQSANNSNNDSSSEVTQSDSGNGNSSSSNSNNSQPSTGATNPPPTDNGGGDTTPPADSGSDGNDDGGDDCPGNSCNAPGQNKDKDKDKDCPGNSCNAPGQNKDKKDKKNK